MKKAGLFIVFWITSLVVFAQTGIGHLMFEDIPIDGKRGEFIGKLVQKGYKYLPMDNQTILYGEYARYKECYISLQASVNDNMACVIVDFPRRDIWAELLADYSSIKDTLINKYGSPSVCSETMDSLLTDDDREKIKKAWYNTKFDNGAGTITLHIEDDRVHLVFLDKVNEAIAQYDFFQRDNLVVQIPNEVYKLFPTENIWTFIKLNTRNGNMWQVQFDTGDNRFETILNIKDLVELDGQKNGRFTLYPTTNAYNFILLDQIDGRTWQVQWSMKPQHRKIIPINDIPSSY